MEAVWNVTVKVSRIFAVLGGILLLVAAVLVSAEVFSRKFFTVVYSGSAEIGAYLFAVGTTWSLSYVLVTRGHVRIDALYGVFPRRLRAFFDLVAMILLGLVVYTMVDRAYDLMHTNFVEWNMSNTPMRTPLALPQIPWLLGLALFFVTIVIAFIRTVSALSRGDYVTANKTAGVASQDEEIESELTDLGIAFEGKGGGGDAAGPGGSGR
jgi:TRAP-type mannitol/chloroaromatic compound transport system permease small subunit